MNFKQNYTLRKPSGPSLVGGTLLCYEYQPAQADSGTRLLPCLCLYPAGQTGGARQKDYAHEEVHPGTGTIVSNTWLDAPVAEGKHPLLLFSHGFGLFHEANTVQLEELASHGYIVLCIGHQGEGSYELPGGEILKPDMEQLMKDYQADAKGMERFPEYAAWLAGDGRSASLAEYRCFYHQMIELQPGLTAQSARWIEDSLAALDRLLHDPGKDGRLLAQHIDTGKIGAFGMSFGGSTALGLTQASDLIQAGANLDGFYYNTNWQKPLHKPVLLLQNDAGLFLDFPYANAEGDAYLATFRNSTHANFADYNEILAENYIAKGEYQGQEMEQAMLGSIDPGRMEDLLNLLLLDFFNKYLRGEESKAVDREVLPEEVKLVRRGSIRQ
ncbi:hypothetical protein [Paenibacillus sp. S150]|uniref:alpha/beta hydrolase n=1 Tax=Paenibacillus sp. S150 TaxID=2749826 RepID=UPI001C590F38|nr:hypothetical protein [Paenibacillus sp. S150]MBW4083411.1 hypothetical protein [Paenibacillus sp. S150]